MSEKKGYDYRKGFSVNAKANPTSAEAKAPFIDNGSGPISPKRYFSEEWMKRERSHLWAKVWNWAGR